MKLGLKYNARNQIVNDLKAIRFPDDIDYRSDKFPSFSRVSGTYLYARFDQTVQNIAPLCRRTPSRSTVPCDFTGYRPVTTVRHSQRRHYIVISYKVSSIPGSTGPSWEYTVVDDVVEITPDYDFDFSNKIAPRFADAYSAFNAQYGIILGTGKETLTYLLQNLRRLHEAFRAVKRGDLRSLRRVIQSYHKGKWKPATAGNLWLEFRYGLTPLFHDISDVMKDWSKVRDDTSKFLRMSFGSGDTIIQGQGLLWPPGASNLPPVGNLSISIDRRQRFGYVFRENPGFGTFNSGSIVPVSDWKGLTTAFLDPLSTAWDLVPYSFVADWFVNVGNCLQQDGQLYRNITIADGFNRRKSSIIGASITSSDFNVTDVMIHDVSPFYERSSTVTLPSSTLTIDLPDASLKHLIDSIFLLTQSHKRPAL